jgi:type I restriction enzyme S subunit
MSLPRYPKYKDSGVEWLGEVPEHWEAKPLKALATMNDDVLPETTEPDYEIDYVDIGSVSLESGIEKTETFVFANAPSRARRKTLDGDVLVSTVRTYLKAICAIKNPAENLVVSTGFAVVRPRIYLHPSFAQYALQSSGFVNEVIARSTGVSYPAINPSELGRIYLSTPPLSEQSIIATFLDRETAKIDALVEEQRRLIELLKEKRHAVISHAVTKGLNPHAKMKPSGIEWLGDVPAHWDVFPLKRDLKFLTSGSRGWAENYSDEGDLFIRIGNLTRDSIEIDLSDIQRVVVPPGSEGARTSVQSGDVLFSITAYLGSVAIVPEDIEMAYVSQHVALARLLQNRLSPRWVGYVTLSNIGKTYLETQGYGGTKIQLSLDDVANLLMTVPPLDEQTTLTNFLDLETSRFDALTGEATRAIDLLQERRTALISAAVTGKIDVRGESHVEQ